MSECARCGDEMNAFTEDWTREQAYEEAEHLWGMTRAECDAAPAVCDECFRMMTAVAPPSRKYIEVDRRTAKRRRGQ